MKPFKKKRKPRTTGKDLNFDGSHMFGQPFGETIATQKILQRHLDGLCIGCGEKQCKCKSES